MTHHGYFSRLLTGFSFAGNLFAGQILLLAEIAECIGRKPLELRTDRLVMEGTGFVRGVIYKEPGK